MKTLVAALAIVVLASLLAGCSGGRVGEPEAEALSASAAADYALFTVRCSKCHSLSRPLNSGIDRDDYWRLYVARMRRQPGSGISEEDTVAILRFLHVYSIEQRRKKEQRLGVDPSQSPPVPPPPVPPPPAAPQPTPQPPDASSSAGTP